MWLLTSQVHPTCKLFIKHSSSSGSPLSPPPFLAVTLSFVFSLPLFWAQVLLPSTLMGYNQFLPSFPASSIHTSLIYSATSFSINLPSRLIQSSSQILCSSQCLESPLIHLPKSSRPFFHLLINLKPIQPSKSSFILYHLLVFLNILCPQPQPHSDLPLLWHKHNKAIYVLRYPLYMPCPLK